jgi:prepilin-type N-terminal cleavage/methylation domain-containing protein
MKRPVTSSQVPVVSTRARPGFTLIEILVATTLTLLLMGAVVTIFGRIGNSVNESRSTLEMADHLRSTAAMLQKDLAGATATMLPPRRIDDGYFEIIEGPVGVTTRPDQIAVNSDTGGADGTVIDFDDILMFTTRTTGRPFVGRYADGTVQSDLAEVIWFVRGRTLYRRVLLIAPWVNSSGANGPGIYGSSASGFYANNDISVRLQNGMLVANSLADLTRRECRYAHDYRQFPYDSRGWGQLGMPTLRECSSSSWSAGGRAPEFKYANTLDFWSPDPAKVHPWSGVDPETGALADGGRVDDVILNYVIGFDVKVWDPGAAGGAGAYVDLGWNNAAFNPNPPAAQARQLFYHVGDPRSLLAAAGAAGTATAARVYDTWSFSYEQIVGQGRGINGFDDAGSGIVDGPADAVTAPPYPAPLRGIQIKIRVFEPDSRQVREVTVVQDFLPK